MKISLIYLHSFLLYVVWMYQLILLYNQIYTNNLVETKKIHKKKYCKTNADGLTVTAPPIINITIQIMYLCPAVAMVRDPFGSPADCCTITSWPSLSHDCFCQTFIISRSYSIKITDKGRIVISWLCTSPQVTPPVHSEILPFLVQGPTTLEKALQVLGISYI